MVPLTGDTVHEEDSRHQTRDCKLPLDDFDGGFPPSALVLSAGGVSSSSPLQTPAGSAAPDTWEHNVAGWVYFNHLAAKISLQLSPCSDSGAVCNRLLTKSNQ